VIDGFEVPVIVVNLIPLSPPSSFVVKSLLETSMVVGAVPPVNTMLTTSPTYINVEYKLVVSNQKYCLGPLLTVTI
jgi:hypothetical protein